MRATLRPVGRIRAASTRSRRLRADAARRAVALMSDIFKTIFLLNCFCTWRWRSGGSATEGADRRISGRQDSDCV